MIDKGCLIVSNTCWHDLYKFIILFYRITYILIEPLVKRLKMTLVTKVFVVILITTTLDSQEGKYTFLKIKIW